MHKTTWMVKYTNNFWTEGVINIIVTVAAGATQGAAATTIAVVVASSGNSNSSCIYIIGPLVFLCGSRNVVGPSVFVPLKKRSCAFGFFAAQETYS